MPQFVTVRPFIGKPLLIARLRRCISIKFLIILLICQEHVLVFHSYKSLAVVITFRDIL